MRDSIQREVVVKAPQERVWHVLTEPAQVARWFGQRAEFELREGAPARFRWDDYGWFSARIERVEPPTSFCFRWAEDPDRPLEDSPSTLVEFTLTANHDGTTTVRVVESGFARFPTERQRAAYEEHVDGWQLELDELVALIDALPEAATP
ncbi:activator of HSP90 ATPase [Phytoactinopolyspora alkaliphila]|uniref:Activator of HSP90 ATPase n=1 Tax=Phytoactinopolyspora alkaliphila TaxID=1783498 RepID=A0A6N9YMR7_9ACTN|nr:SRPBCC domain-containing protein [Phytoactinopolyspora alkaliphila]NED96210.1 activator of HSP90 ATPase [Phytoactinopolyspora alkaliphila]